MGLREATRKRNPFVAKVNEQSLAKATQFRQRKAEEARRIAMENTSLEFIALQEEEIEHAEHDDLGEMDVTGNSALDMLGEADNAVDDIEAKMEQE